MTTLTTKQLYVINTFKQRFETLGYGEGHFIFACHAAFPIAVNVDMLYQIWKNFKDYKDANHIDKSINRIAVSDFLLSGLFRTVSHDLYELEVEVRGYFLEQLKTDPRFGKQRLQDLAMFLWQYTTHHTTSDDVYQSTQYWAALATLAPQQAASKIKQLLEQPEVRSNRSELSRLNSLLASYSHQNPVFDGLMDLSKGLKTLAGRRRVRPSALANLEITTKADGGIPIQVSRKSLKQLNIELPNENERTIYALIVGINDYQAVGKIGGAVNDAKKVKAFIEKNYNKTNIVTLLDEAATYQNVYNTFIEHLGQATENDTALFYFGGQGGREIVHEAFYDFFPSKIMGTIICQDSRMMGKSGTIYDLSEVELIYLISRISLKQPHIVLIIDACYSGSHRNMMVNNSSEVFIENTTQSHRASTTVTKTRPLDKLADGFYANQLSTASNITIPSVSYIHFAASGTEELSYESRGSGVFTTALIDILSSSNLDTISYGNLIEEISISIKGRFPQNPEIKTFGQTNIWSTFLKGNPQINYLKYIVSFNRKDRAWTINAGFLQGLPKDANDLLLTITEDNKLIAQARVKAVGLENSTLTIVEGQEYLEVTKNYLCTIPFYPNSIRLYSNCTIEEHDELLERAFVKFSNYANSADYILYKDLEEQYHIIDPSNKMKIFQHTEKLFIKDAFMKLKHRKIMQQLQNPQTKLSTNDIVIDLKTTNYGKAQTINIDKGEAEVPLIMEGNYETITYEFEGYNNIYHPVHVIVLFISPLYGIMVLSDTTLKPKESIILVKDKMSFLQDAENQSNTTLHFKFLITKTRINAELLSQVDFSDNIELNATEYSAIINNMKNVDPKAELEREVPDEYAIKRRRRSEATNLDWMTKDFFVTLNQI